ncbi:MAG TPA: response regulator transcription factor [Bryobacteraceae bacterium]|jgi:two-component system response regulator MprA|nr:response regulator transcription factor [Bryobacteraceae bacterium]
MWILIVEDEPAMTETLRQFLEEQNHTVTIARDGREALSATEMCGFDAIILDVMIPSPNGIEVARRLRQAGNKVGILMLTARDAPEDIVEGLDAGADDYLVKPFALRVLVARLRALARRAAQPPVQILQVDDLTLDPASCQVTRAGRTISLTATEFRFLEHLMRRAGRVASRSSIIEAVWGFNEEVESNTVDVYVKLLRDKIDSGQKKKLIQTVRGYGYVMRELS